MVRQGLGPGWQCAFANDYNIKKVATYRKNWGASEMVPGDIRKVEASSLPTADLAWASFPCQDFSLAGAGAGLKGERSGTFYPFWKLITNLKQLGRAPRVVVLENVSGTLTSHGGKDFVAICRALSDGGYRTGALVVDAALFVPQSRPRLFLFAVSESVDVPESLTLDDPASPFHIRSVKRAHAALPPDLAKSWIWWSLPKPCARAEDFIDIIEEHPDSVRWHSPKETAQLLAMMSPINRAKVDETMKAGRRMVGGIYKRTRREKGRKVQRAEVRFDNLSGCLRTPAGGSSRQLIIMTDGENIRSRLISSRETARLMGLPDSYELPDAYNEAYHLTGDGVVVPVVRHLAKHLIEPLLDASIQSSRESAA